MNNKTLAIALLAGGIVLLLVAATADMTGLGASPLFGWKQISASVVGALLAVAGVVLIRKD